MKRSDNVKTSITNFILNLRREILKTGHIGKKLLTAGRTNSHLKETYEALGRLIEYKIDNNEINPDDPRIRALIHTIKACKKDLKDLEEEVKKIKFASAPEDISKRLPPKKED